MNISKTTHNFAKAREFEITVWADDSGDIDEYAVWFESDDDEPAFIMSASDNGFFLMRNLQIDSAIWEELWYWMSSEVDLRQMLNFIFLELKETTS